MGDGSRSRTDVPVLPVTKKSRLKFAKFTNLTPGAEAALLRHVRDAARRISALGKRTLPQALRAGRMLSEARAKIRHGQWLPFLAASGVSEASARNWTNMYEASRADLGYRARLRTMELSAAYEEARAILHPQPGAPDDGSPEPSPPSVASTPPPSTVAGGASPSTRGTTPPVSTVVGPPPPPAAPPPLPWDFHADVSEPDRITIEMASDSLPMPRLCAALAALGNGMSRFRAEPDEDLRQEVARRLERNEVTIRIVRKSASSKATKKAKGASA
jgi:hypothetical protein